MCADATNLRARNQETAPLFNSVSAELIPESSSRVKVQFKQFKVQGGQESVSMRGRCCHMQPSLYAAGLMRSFQQACTARPPLQLLGLVPITAPPTAVGKLEVTYLDEELRVSRGDKGNTFVLKMKVGWLHRLKMTSCPFRHRILTHSFLVRALLAEARREALMPSCCLASTAYKRAHVAYDDILEYSPINLI